MFGIGAMNKMGEQGGMGNPVSDSVQQATDGVTEALRGIGPAITEALQELGPTLAGALSEIVDALMDLLPLAAM